MPEEYGGAWDEGLAIVIGAEEPGYSPAGATAGATALQKSLMAGLM